MDNSALTSHQKLAIRLNDQYPNDVGVIVSFLLNYLTLSPGEALVLGPNEPHAYLHGEGIECMATSDNVVRGGLTPKLKDAKVLVEMLTYSTERITPLKGEKLNESDESLRIYQSGFPEFDVLKVVLNEVSEEGKEKIEKKVRLENPGILL